MSSITTKLCEEANSTNSVDPTKVCKVSKKNPFKTHQKNSNNCELFKKPRKTFRELMSCFDRDHRVVVQRGTSSASGSAVSKNGPPSSAPTPPVAVRPSGSGVTSMVVTPRASKTVHTNSTIKLKNLKERLKDDSSPISPEAKLELEVEYADCLCDLGRFREAANIYARIFGCRQTTLQLPCERLRHFVKVLTKVTVDSVANAGVSLSKFAVNERDSSRKDQQLLLYLPGQTCPDPFSCPSCAGVLSDPISLPCGHSFCRKCVAKTSALTTACLKCGAQWNPADSVAQQQAGVEKSEMVAHLKPNVLIGKLVTRYWSDDLRANDLKTKANSLHQQGKLERAIDVYTQAIALAPTDHLLLGNRSLSYHQMGCHDLALADAIKATEMKPDWAKGYFRKGAALQALGRHEEAFQAFYECLTLEVEDEKAAKKIKLELARELHLLLAGGNEARSRTTSISDESCCYDENGASRSERMDLDESNIIIPLSMVALVEYASTVTTTGAGLTSQLASTLPNWMTRGVTPFRIKCRPLQPSAVVDSSDYECPLCMQLMISPVTTPCGHTFCRRCLDRALDHSAVCPLCKSTTLTAYLAERREAVTEFVEECMRRLIPEEYTERERAVAAELMELAGLPATPFEPARASIVGNFEEADSCPEIPIFVCTMSFPNVRCPLHIFEPRYRLMIRRTMEIGTRQFGMTCKVKANEPFSEFGTMLEIRDIHVFRDGRSVIDTRGRRRFRVLERRIRDGYNVATVEFLKDVPVPQESLEELIQIHDETLEKTREWFSTISPETKTRLDNHYGDMPTVESDYWDLPNGPSWHWWTIAILPLDPQAQVQVLSQTSLKKRLETIQRILKYMQSQTM